MIVADNDQSIKGSHYELGAEYVDYTTPENGETITAITQDLLDQKFVKFEKEVNMR